MVLGLAEDKRAEAISFSWMCGVGVPAWKKGREKVIGCDKALLFFPGPCLERFGPLIIFWASGKASSRRAVKAREPGPETSKMRRAADLDPLSALGQRRQRP